MLKQKEKQALRKEVTDLLGIPEDSCTIELARRFYRWGLPLFPKSMTKGEVKGLISKTLGVSDEEVKKIFKQLKHGGLVCGTYDPCSVGDVTIISLRKINRGGEVLYTPVKYNPAYDGGLQGG